MQPETLCFACYPILFTIYPRQGVPAAEVLGRHRLGRQVEPALNRFESPAQLGHSRKADDESTRVWLYANLLLALLIGKLACQALTILPFGYNVATGSRSQSIA